MTGGLWEWALFFLAAAIHEMGHIFAIYLSGFRVKRIIADPRGLVIRTDSSLIPYRKEIFIYLAGPVAGLLFGALTLFLIRRGMTEPLLYFFFCNAILSLLNLLPIRGLDGYGALFSFLCLFTSRERAEKILRPWHASFLLILSFSGLFLFYANRNPSLILLTLLLILDGKRKKATKIS